MNHSRLTLFAGLMLPLLLSASPAVKADNLTLNKGDRVAIIGNTLADRMQHDGWLETFVQDAFPEHGLVFRNLGFSADEIRKRPRSADFGSPDDWLKHVKADVVFAFFGYNEALRGEQGLVAFRKDLEDLVDGTRAQNYSGKGNARIVLFSPIAHEDHKNPNLPDGSSNNNSLAKYTRVMKEVAAAKKVPFVDLFSPTEVLFTSSRVRLTINGIHLNETGNRLVASMIAMELFDYNEGADLQSLEKLRQAVLDKNLHFWSRYRTVDGYNVYGGRSRLSWHGQSNADVMKREMEVFGVMTENRDKRIHAIAKGGDLEIDDSNTPALIPVRSNRPGKNADGSHTYLGGEEAISRMKIHEGMEVNLFASEEDFPELINPVQMAVDTDSRLWAVTWPTYPHWNPKEPMGDKLVILPDDNGDGKADRMITFADNLNSVTGFEFWGGGVLVAAAPEILFLKDTDGDDKADVRIRMLNGVSSADTHHTANALTIGPDGGLYWSRGVFHVTNMETPTKTFRSTSSGVYRFDPRTFEVDFHFPIGPNPHGDVFDAWGNQYVCDGTGGTGNYIGIGKGKGMYRQLYQKRVRPVPANGILSSSHFPPENDGNFLICNAIGFLGVLQHEFKYNGAEITCEEVDPILVSSDPNFRPSDVEVGGDGALYVADWHQALIGHMQHNMRDPNRDRKHGRIYRVTAKGRPLLKPAKMKGKPISEVLEYFKSAEHGTRYRARLELSGRATDAAVVGATKHAATLDPTNEVDAMALLQCLWVHSEARVGNFQLAKKTFQAQDPRIRAAVARTVGWWAEKMPGEALPLILKAARDSEALVRAEAVVAAANFPPSMEVADVIFEAASRPTDPHIEYVLNYATGVLKVNALANNAITSGHRLSPAGERYMVRRASDAALLKMARTDAVNIETFHRASMPPEQRAFALALHAQSREEPPARVLLRAIDEARAAQDGAADLAFLLPRLRMTDLVKVKPELRKLAGVARDPGVRSAVIAALVNAGEDAAVLLKASLATRSGLSVFLEAVPLFANARDRAALYPMIRPLAFELPENLRKETMATAGVPGVRFDYYEADSFPDCKLETLAKRKPKNSGTVQEMTHIIPGRRADKFYIKLTTWLQVPASGKYEFSLSTDDGSRLYIDGKLVIDHDGNHGMGERKGSVQLGEGSHRLVTTYFDSGGDDGYQLLWSGPGIKKQPIDPKYLGGSGGGLERVAARFLSSLPGNDAAIYADMVALLGEGKHREIAVKHLSRSGPVPVGQLSALGKALTSAVPETPIEARDGDVFKQSLALAKKVAAMLPEPEAKVLNTATSDLDLAVIRISALWEQLKYDRIEFVVKAGKPVKVIFSNPDKLPHNLMIVEPGKADEVARAAEKLGAEGFDLQWRPEHKAILHATKMLNQGDRQELSFRAPENPGEYPYVCTFPGHAMLMRGVMRVVE